MAWESWNAVMWVAQIISVAATFCTVFSFQCKSSKMLLLWQGVIGGTLWTVHFALIGAWASCLLNSICLIRALVTGYCYTHVKRGWMLGTLMVLMAAAGAFGAVIDWNKPDLFVPLWFFRVVLILLTVSMLVSTYTLWTGRGRLIRYAALFFVSPMWFINNLLVGSIFGVLTETFNILSTVVSLIRFRKGGKNSL